MYQTTRDIKLHWIEEMKRKGNEMNFKTWRSKSCFDERSLADSGSAIVSNGFPQLSPKIKRLTS